MFKDAMMVVGGILAFLVAVVALSWFFMGNDFFMYKYFAPKQEAVHREVFEQSKAYNQGMVQEIQNMQFEYIKADPDHKAALAQIILHRVADYKGELPYDLRVFIQELRGGVK